MAIEIVSLQASYKSDGEGVDAFLSRPAGLGPWSAVITIHEIWGLDDHTRDVTRRLAAEGFVALAPDLYHGKVTSDFGEARRLRATVDLDQAVREINAGIPYLRSLPFTSEKIGVMGFCMGGGLAFLAACRSTEFSVAATYYPTIQPSAEQIANLACPLLIHYGTADAVTPMSEMERIIRDLEEKSKSHELHFYQGAAHAFANERGDLYRREAAETSWRRTLEFLRRHLGGEGSRSVR